MSVGRSRAAYALAERGRELWRSLAAWPWWGTPAGLLNQGWERDPLILQRFAVWLDLS